MAKRFFIRRNDFKKLERYAEDIYNTAIVIDYFCSAKVKFMSLKTFIL